MSHAEPLSPLAAIAESQIGTQEDSAHTNRGAAILKYQQATELDGQGWPWCAAFVDWCVRELLEQFPNLTAIPLAERPRTASAFGWEEWARAHHCAIIPGSQWQPRLGEAFAVRGDVVIFAFSHIGIVVQNDANGLITVEGNTNAEGGRDGFEVARRNRSGSGARGHIRCFCRLPLKGTPAAAV